MARVPQVDYATAPPEIQAAWDEVARRHRVSNMKATALHSPVATRAILEWYALYDEVEPFLGQRLAILYSHAIAKQNACKVCWTYMRKEVIDRGEDPDNAALDEREAAVVELGRQMAADPERIDDAVFATLSKYFTDKQIVEIVTFGALMVLNNIFNSALQVELDDVLGPYEISPEQIAGGA
jgi:alkylhydroperoxidase family enzyme